MNARRTARIGASLLMVVLSTATSAQCQSSDDRQWGADHGYDNGDNGNHGNDNQGNDNQGDDNGNHADGSQQKAESTVVVKVHDNCRTITVNGNSRTECY